METALIHKKIYDLASDGITPEIMKKIMDILIGEGYGDNLLFVPDNSDLTHRRCSMMQGICLYGKGIELE